MIGKSIASRQDNPRTYAQSKAWVTPDGGPILDPDLPIIDAHHHIIPRDFPAQWDPKLGIHVT